MCSGYRPISQHCFNKEPNYTFENLIGSGSFGCVYKAYNNTLETYVAIKRSAKIGSLISREYKILKETEDSNYCVKLLDIFYTVTEDQKFVQHLVFEYLPNNLSRFIRSRFKAKSTLHYEEIASIMKQILLGLEFLHSKDILHRDLKPENILIDTNSKPYRVKLCDFGSAKKRDNKSTPYIVSRYYRAPELILCNTDYGPPIDIWAAGCILLELYTGTPIFIGKTEGDQFVKQANLLGKPSQAEVESMTGNSLISKKLKTMASQIGKRQDLIGIVGKRARSEEAISLALSMLQWDPQKRPNASECLQHDFFVEKS